MISIALIVALVITITYLTLLSNKQLGANTRSQERTIRRSTTPLPNRSENRRAAEEANLRIFTGEYSYP